jgi:hypothetical protein
MSRAWEIYFPADGTGMIAHRAAPRFRALWTTGLAGLDRLDGLFWTDEGQGEDDAITLHSFLWDDPPPDQDAFEALMRTAAAEIDAWIAGRL